MVYTLNHNNDFTKHLDAFQHKYNPSLGNVSFIEKQVLPTPIDIYSPIRNMIVNGYDGLITTNVINELVEMIEYCFTLHFDGYYLGVPSMTGHQVKEVALNMAMKQTNDNVVLACSILSTLGQYFVGVNIAKTYMHVVKNIRDHLALYHSD